MEIGSLLNRVDPARGQVIVECEAIDWLGTDQEDHDSSPFITGSVFVFCLPRPIHDIFSGYPKRLGKSGVYIFPMTKAKYGGFQVVRRNLKPDHIK